MRIRHCIGVLALVALGCSDQSDPVRIAPPADDGYLSRMYRTLYAGQWAYFETSPSYVALRFEPGLSSADVDAFLKKHALRVERDPDPLYGLYVVGVNNAFAEAEALAKNPELVYVGPVFWVKCGTHFLLAGNQIIVTGDATDEAVQALLREESATLVRVDAEIPAAVHYVYELPWGTADHLFDLCLRLTYLEAVSYSEPNFILPCL